MNGRRYVGYEVWRGSRVVFEKNCAECVTSQCECVVTALEKSRDLGAGHRVQGVTDTGKRVLLSTRVRTEASDPPEAA